MRSARNLQPAHQLKKTNKQTKPGNFHKYTMVLKKKKTPIVSRNGWCPFKAFKSQKLLVLAGDIDRGGVTVIHQHFPSIACTVAENFCRGSSLRETNRYLVSTSDSKPLPRLQNVNPLTKPHLQIKLHIMSSARSGFSKLIRKYAECCRFIIVLCQLLTIMLTYNWSQRSKSVLNDSCWSLSRPFHRELTDEELDD